MHQCLLIFCAPNSKLKSPLPMSRLFQLGSTLLGRLGSYVITKEIHRAADDAAVFLARDDNGKNAIIKSIRGHWRLQNEASVLKRYQTRSPYLRPLVDEIQVPLDPPSIVLRYLDNDLLSESNQRRLSRPQIKQVARAILEALKVLHKDGMVHTGRSLS
ncbi:hypothetical protein VTK73DRAFT_7561 [Phialemonium thermophilum]|uniref:Protein kinase domain-containing protein n=1 Tax=Phialemonium thermophilum TaxID=223376 RepID=A0ABR3XSV7_9PEZI